MMILELISGGKKVEKRKGQVSFFYNFYLESLYCTKVSPQSSNSKKGTIYKKSR